MRSTNGVFFDVTLYWCFSVLGIFVGFVALTILEKRIGQISTKVPFLILCASVVFISSILMLLNSSQSPEILRIFVEIGAFATGVFTSPFYIAWTAVYGKLDGSQSEILIALSVAVGELLSIMLCGMTGWLATLFLLIAPVGNLFTVMICLYMLEIPNQARPDDTNLSVKRTVFDWRCGLFAGSLWFLLSILTALVSFEAHQTLTEFSQIFLLSFIAGFIILAIALVIFLNFSKRITLLQAARFVVPPVVAGTLGILFIPEATPLDAFTVVSSALTFFWTILWIYCVKVVRESQVTATHAMGTVRGWIQGGAALSIPVVAFSAMTNSDSSMLLYFCVILLLCSFSLSIPVLVDASSMRRVVNLDMECLSPAPDEEPTKALEPSFDERCEMLAAKYGLSPRETEIANLLVRGRDLPFIRDTLYISRNTINTHIRHIYEKMNIHSKQELIDLFEACKA